MAKFATFKDMFKWNKQLMEDDFNDGKLYTLKHKKDLGNKTEIETNVKVDQAKGTSHKLAADHKVKYSIEEFGGAKFEVKGDNLKGNIDAKCEFNCLDKVEGLEGTILHTDFLINTGSKVGATGKAGFTWTNDQIKTKNLVSLSSKPVFESESSWAPCPHFQIGEKAVCDREKKDYQFELAMAGHFDKTMQYGTLVKFAHQNGKLGYNLCTLYFNQVSGKNTAGAFVTYDAAKKAYSSSLGLKMVQDDHTWKFKFSDSGMANAMLQWQLHQAVKATLTSQMDLKTIPNGKLDSSLPLGFNFEIKY